MERAIALLPPELRPLFEKHRAKVVERIIDPDTWRAAGFRRRRARTTSSISTGRATARSRSPSCRATTRRRWRSSGARASPTTARVPWRAEEMFGNLQRAFQDYGRRGAFGQNDIIHFSAWLSHYVSDAIQPFHGVINYDGQLTKQNGVHARFETALVERYMSELVLTPTAAAARPRAARLHLRAADRGHAAGARHPEGRPRRHRHARRLRRRSTSTRSSAPRGRCSNAGSATRLPPWRP